MKKGVFVKTSRSPLRWGLKALLLTRVSTLTAWPGFWKQMESSWGAAVHWCVCKCVISVVLRSRSGVFNHTPTRSGRHTYTHKGWCRHTVCVWYCRHHTKSFPVLLHISDLNTVTNCWHSSSYNQPCIHCPAACIQTHTKEVSPFIWYFSLLPTQVTF